MTELTTKHEPAARAGGANPGQSSQADALGKGTVLGRYVVLRQVGLGGMGVVYAAYDPELDRKIAIKLLRPERQDVEARTRLQREAQAMARLSHPNVLAVYDVGTFQDQVFVAIELVEGQTLADWLRVKLRPWKEVLRIFTQAGQGLAAAHRAGIVHRDFKPANVLLGEDGRARVLDFGLARACGEAGPVVPVAPDARSLEAVEGESTASPLSTPVTRAGLVLGTLPYMSPEQPSSRGADARSDQFSFSVAFYEALYGEHPFAIQGDSNLQLIDRMLQGEIKLPPAGSRVPSWLRRIVLRGLSVEPSARFPSMDALLEALERGPLTRRRWGMAAAALALFAGLGLTLFGSRESQLCKGGESQVAEVWSTGRKFQAQRAFAATGLPFASATWRGVERTLDDYTATWSQLYTSTCEATHLHGEQSAELLDLRMLCLRERLAEVQALTDVFLEADTQVVERALASTQSLENLQICAAATAPADLVPLPQDASSRTLVEQGERDLARARVLYRVGRFREALPILEEVALRARRIPYLPLAAEALTVLGDVQMWLEDYESAADTLSEAIWAAEESHGDRVAAEAAILMIWLEGVRQPHLANHARRWSRFAEAKLDRARGDVVRLRADLHEARGSMLRIQGRYEDSLEQHRVALRLRQESGDSGLELANTLDRKGAVLGELGQPEESQERFLRALEIRKAELGPNHPLVGASHNNLGISLKNQGKYEEALEHLQQAREIFESSLGPHHRNVLSAVNNIANSLRGLGRAEEALEVLAPALEDLKDQPDHPKLPILLSTQASTFFDLGRYGEALEAFQRTLELDETALGAEHPFVAEDLAMVGLTQLELGRAAAAIVPLERSVAIRESSQEPASRLASSRWALARALWESGADAARARRLALSAREAFAAAGESSRQDLEAVEAWLVQIGGSGGQR